LDYARALHGYGETLLERGKPVEYTYQSGVAYLHELKWVKAVLDSSQPNAIVQ
jgi:hypothetical protein